MRASLVAVALLALAVSPALATLGDNGMTTYTGRKREANTLVFGNEYLVNQAMAATMEFTRDVLKGTWKPTRNQPATEKQEIQIECLNSVAPAPLNWKMWCPGTDAKVMGWTDKSGALHRSITLRPQAGMTSTMYQWFITAYVMGLMPPVVEFQGNHYYYYHLWHPLDHVESALSLGPAVPIMQKGVPFYVLIHERYRNPASFTANRHFETNGWFYVEDAVTNLMKNRYVITMPLMGIPTWTLILEFNDTPEGLVVDAEVVAGLPHKGYDERAPQDGYHMAAGLNEMFTAPLVAKQRGSVDFEESITAITRHVIEEFSNLQHFVPYLYNKYTVLGKAGISWIPTLGTWLQYNKRALGDSSSISMYNALAGVAAKLIDVSNTTHGQLVDAAFNKSMATFDAATAFAVKASEKNAQLTYVPASNALTKWAYDTNTAAGAKKNVSVTAGPAAGMNDAMVAKVHALLNSTAKSLGGASAAVSMSSAGGGNATKAFGHNLGKGMAKMFSLGGKNMSLLG